MLFNHALEPPNPNGARLGGALAGFSVALLLAKPRHRLLARQIPLCYSSRASARSARNTSTAAASSQTRSGLRLSAALCVQIKHEATKIFPTLLR